MYCDPRGGHNRKVINENFFKFWSPQMAYVLGLIFADGAVEDVRKSSRTCYIAITSNDKLLLEQVRSVLSSEHNIYSRKPRIQTFGHTKSYLCRETFTLRVGNKMMYQSLVEIGLTPRKSLNMKLPDIRGKFFGYFLRGYFDGDGNISCYIPKGRNKPRIRLTFVSGSYKFLDALARKIQTILNTTSKSFLKKKGQNAYYLRYSKRDGLKILGCMYKNLDDSPYLKRKYDIYQSFLSYN